MKVWIQPEAIAISNTKYLPKGLVHFCSALQTEGFGFSTNLDSLTKRQKAQLKVEDIFAEFNSKDSNGMIEFDKSEGKLEFWLNEIVIASGYDFPELLSAFEDDAEFKKAFHKLTPGRQRGYLLHFASAKQSSTRVSRIERAKTKIYEGKGHNER